MTFFILYYALEYIENWSPFWSILLHRKNRHKSLFYLLIINLSPVLCFLDYFKLNVNKKSFPKFSFIRYTQVYTGITFITAIICYSSNFNKNFKLDCNLFVYYFHYIFIICIKAHLVSDLEFILQNSAIIMYLLCYSFIKWLIRKLISENNLDFFTILFLT